MAPTGTVTTSDVLLALVTVALVAPKYTTLADGVVAKPVPWIVTALPTGAEAGEKLVMVGCAQAASCRHKAVSNTQIALARTGEIAFPVGQDLGFGFMILTGLDGKRMCLCSNVKC